MTRKEVKKITADGLMRGISGFLWIMKILLPISFATTLSVHFGLLSYIHKPILPVMSFLGMGPDTALPLLIGLLTGIYGAIAAMAALPLSMNDMTLVAIFLLIAHNLIQEGMVQSKSGMPFAIATIIRLTTAMLVVPVVSMILPESGAAPLAPQIATSVSHEGISGVLISWSTGIFILSIQIFLIITALMVVMAFMRELKVIEKTVSVMTPVLRLMGLSPDVAVLWLTAAIFGLAYGAAVIVEEARDDNIAPKDLKRLHVSIGINHAVIEDPALFLPLGISPVWLWVPRWIAAIIGVQMVNLWFYFSFLWHTRKWAHHER